MGKQGEISCFENIGDERPNYISEFDCVVFFDSLHHAVDEELAIQKAYEASEVRWSVSRRESGSGTCDFPEAIEHIENMPLPRKRCLLSKDWISDGRPILNNSAFPSRP
jgi:hypothetical protein